MPASRRSAIFTGGAARRLLVLIVALQFCAMLTASAQESSANIQGRVEDARGAVVPDVKITVINDGQGIQRETVTNREGYFVVPLLPAGTYTLTAEMPGFATIRVVDIVLQVSINSYVPLTLNPAPVTEAVTVGAESNRIDTSNATVKYSVTNEQVSGLPVLTSASGRNPLTLLPFLVPGVTPTNNYGTTSFTTNTFGGDMSVNGARTTSVSYNLDGGDNNNYEENVAASTLPNPDALQEFTILTNNYQADQGRSSGGIINAVGKSGTNQFHGNVRYYGINEALNARGFFDPETPVNRLHTYGGQLGGPVVLPGFYNGRERTFFFVDYEGTRSRQGAPFSTTVPSLKEREGNFSDLPVSRRPRDPLTRQPFPGGVIPQSRFNSLTRAYVEQFIPLPNNGPNGFVTELVTDRRNNQVTARVDQNIGRSDHLNATFFYSRSETVADSFSLFPIGTQRFGAFKTANFILSETHTFSPRTVHQFTGTIVRYVTAARTVAPGATGVAPSEFGFTGIRPQTEKFLGIPAINVLQAGFRIDPTQGSFEDFATTWQLKSDLSHSRGNHALKFGGGVVFFRLNKFQGNNNGSFTFLSSPARGTNNPIADLLLGLPSSFNQNTGSSIFPRQSSSSLYAMDDWRVRPNLTVNLGLRYELVPPLKDELDQVSVFRPGQKSERFPNAPLGLLFAGDPDPVLGVVPRAGYPADKNNLAPRLGIAYSPRPANGWARALLGDGKTAIRAGWGVFYDATFGRSFTEVRSTQPFSAARSLSANQMAAAGGTFANPYGSLPNPFPLDLNSRTFTGAPQVQPFDPSFRTAYTYQYNLTIQRELPWATLLELAYVGSNSFKQNRERQINLATVGPGATPDDLQQRRLFPQLSDILSQESTGRAHYNAAQVRLSRRFEEGLAFDASYVFSKALDNATTATLGVDSNPARWARSANDRRHNFVASFTYELPAAGGRGFLGRLTKGWQVGGITEFRSGLPLDIIQLGDPTLAGVTISGNPDFVGPYVQFDPRRFQTITVNGVPFSGNFFFDPNAFRLVEVTDFTQAREGTLGRNVFDGPGINLWSLSVIKGFSIAESHQIEFRADIRNLFNHALFAQPVQEVDGLTPAGVVLTSGPGRTIQLAVRYRF